MKSSIITAHHGQGYIITNPDSSYHQNRWILPKDDFDKLDESTKENF